MPTPAETMKTEEGDVVFMTVRSDEHSLPILTGGGLTWTLAAGPIFTQPWYVRVWAWLRGKPSEIQYTFKATTGTPR